MESNQESRILQAFEQPQFTLGNKVKGREILCPDLNISIKEEDDYDKDESDPDNQLIYLYDEDEIKDEPYSPETKTENEDPVDEQDYSCPADIADSNNSASYNFSSTPLNCIDTVPSYSQSNSASTSKKKSKKRAKSTVTSAASPVPTPSETTVVSSVRSVSTPIVTHVASCDTSTVLPAVTPLVATMPPLVATSVPGEPMASNPEAIIVSDIQQRIAGSSGPQGAFTNQDVHILALIPGPPPTVDDQDPEEEVQVEVSNKWIESRGDNYVNLSILSGFPNPQVSKSISLTREGIQIFIHKLPLKTTHSLWNILGSRNAIEKGHSLTLIANLVEKMKICTGCWDQKCRDIWEEGVFAERGFVESGFSPSPVYRTFGCQLLIHSESRCDACNECRSEWTNMIRVINKKRRKPDEIRDLDKINYKFLTKADMEHALRETRKEASKYRKQITMLHREIDGLLGEERGRRNTSFCNDKIIIINDKFT